MKPAIYTEYMDNFVGIAQSMPVVVQLVEAVDAAFKAAGLPMHGVEASVGGISLGWQFAQDSVVFMARLAPARNSSPRPSEARGARVHPLPLYLRLLGAQAAPRGVLHVIRLRQVARRVAREPLAAAGGREWTSQPSGPNRSPRRMRHRTGAASCTLGERRRMWLAWGGSLSVGAMTEPARERCRRARACAFSWRSRRMQPRV